MLETFWYSFLYQPLFNALIWIYVNIAGQNLGWAVIWLTIFLRILLLPLTILSIAAEDRKSKAVEEAKAAMKAYKNDRVAQQEAARKVMKKYHISPWAAALNLGIQVLVLVLLYQVFLQGITQEKVSRTLYTNLVDYPGPINISFYGFDIGHHNDYVWAGIATAYLIFSLLRAARKQKFWTKSEMYFLFFFPLFTFFALWYLPMVKSLFILTTMIFTDIIKLVRKMFFPKKETAPVEVVPAVK